MSTRRRTRDYIRKLEGMGNIINQIHTLNLALQTRRTGLDPVALLVERDRLAQGLAYRDFTIGDRVATKDGRLPIIFGTVFHICQKRNEITVNPVGVRDLRVSLTRRDYTIDWQGGEVGGKRRTLKAYCFRVISKKDVDPRFTTYSVN